jgi:hypothetical protein
MKDTSRQNSTTVEMAVESVTTAIKKKAAGVDMKFAPGFNCIADLWCDVDVGVLGTWEKEYRKSPVLAALRLDSAKKALLLDLLQAARKECVWSPSSGNQKTIKTLAGLVDPAGFTIKKIRASLHQIFLAAGVVTEEHLAMPDDDDEVSDDMVKAIVCVAARRAINVAVVKATGSSCLFPTEGKLGPIIMRAAFPSGEHDFSVIFSYMKTHGEPWFFEVHDDMSTFNRRVLWREFQVIIQEQSVGPKAPQSALRPLLRTYQRAKVDCDSEDAFEAVAQAFLSLSVPSDGGGGSGDVSMNDPDEFGEYETGESERSA